MRPAGNKAFTLVELLVVIIVVGILATLVVPAVLTVLDKGKQAKCNKNVGGIIQGLKQYSAATEEMPIVPVSKSGNRTNWDVAVGTNREIPPFRQPGDTTKPTDRPRNHSANLWLLVRGGHVSAEAFICPGSTTDKLGAYKKTSKKISEYWDFAAGNQISYGLQSPYGFDGSLSVITPTGVVLVADGSPHTDDSGKLKSSPGIVNWEGNMNDQDKRLRGNSPNHDSNGQNIGYHDGRVEWQGYANVGKNGDNIYTASNKTARIEEDSTNSWGTLSESVKNNQNDTMILP